MTPRCNLIVVPDRRLAGQITCEALESAQDSFDFLKLHNQLSLNRNPLRVLRRKKFVNEILEILLYSGEAADIRKEIKHYWGSQYSVNELLRFSDKQKQAFDFLRNVFKYHMYEKRDGSIVNSLIGEDGKIISDPDLVNQLLIKRMREIQFDESQPLYTGTEHFPTLEPLTREEFHEITGKLTAGKAMASDLIYDDVYGHRMESGVLRDIWSVDLGLKEYSNLFQCRLVALNKDHPRVPTYDRFRPIVVSSPLVKVIESRFVPKLRDYMLEKLHPSQTGFVPYCGVFVNIVRAVDRINAYFNQERHVYGVFVDFSNAYNTLRHKLLFERLRGILSSEEVLYLEALYSKLSIHAGKYFMRPNIGVAQGSIISLALFNIYLEPLLNLLTERMGILVHGVLAYADDLMILTTGRSRVRDVIQTIEKFSASNGLKLNKQKSGIVEFVPRRSRPYLRWKEICWIPVLTEYKYLGL